MNIFIDGFQNTGKTTLIENCKFKHNRFPFNQYLEEFNLSNNRDCLNGFQIGKDLGILFGLQYSKQNVIFDRGPFSTIFYSLKEMRFNENTTTILIKFISELKKYENCKYVFVKKINSKGEEKRNHQDGFDYLNDDEDQEKEKLLEQIIFTAKKFGVEINIFENDFSLSLKTNYHRFNDFLEGLLNEYN